jgi:hypothetical protein
MLPLAAALKRRSPELKTQDLFEETKKHCINKIDCILN